jgi:hypothetical protein
VALACAPAAVYGQQPTTTATTPQRTSPLGGKLTIGVNVGAQTRSFTSTNDFSFPVYGQTASVTTTSTADGGPMFDVNAAYRVTPMFGVGFGFSSFSRTGTAAGAASIPSPTFFNRPAAVTIDATDAHRSDRNVYIVAVGFLPINETIEMSIFAGPSFTSVRQDLINSVTVPSGTQSVVSSLQSESGTAKGVNVGVDVAYMFRPQIGAGVFVRYNGGSLDLSSASNVKTGGAQLGIGARVRF